MHRDFYLSKNQLVDIARRMAQKTIEGLEKYGGEISCIPTFIPIQKIPEYGRLVALEIGGTNIRCAQVRLNNARLVIEKGPVKEKLINHENRQLDREGFMGRLAEMIHSLSPDKNLPLGYCFSYPSEPTKDGDAVLLRWTKELYVADTVGRKVGKMLCRHLQRESSAWQCSRVRVINDTVAAMLGGMAMSDADAFIGLIVGTGTNMAVLLPPSMIPKISGDKQGAYALPVNLESGNFNPPHLTHWDEKLDREAYNPGWQRFEKAVSGQYLAKLFKLRMPESDLDPCQGAVAVFDRAYGASAVSDSERQLAKQIVDRSARLVAAALAGIISMMVEKRPFKKIAITAEGGVFWGHQTYKETTENTLQDLLSRMEVPEIDFEFLSVDHANLQGIAISGLCEGGFNETA